MASFADSPSQFVDASACGDTDAVVSFLADASFSASSINYVDKDGRSSFHYACLNDDVPLLKILLADARVDVVLTSPKGETALHMASLYAALSAMKLLFEDGRIDPNAQNNFGETALHLAAGSGDKVRLDIFLPRASNTAIHHSNLQIVNRTGGCKGCPAASQGGWGEPHRPR